MERKIARKIIDKYFASNKMLLADIDFTIVDSSERHRRAKDYVELEQLMDSVEDIPKREVISKLKKYVSEGYSLTFVTGRRRRKKTKEQLDSLGFENYQLICNSRIYNPSLSSKELKAKIVSALLEKSGFRGEKKEVVFVEDRLDIIKELLSILKEHHILYRKELLDGVFFLSFIILTP